MAFRANCPCFSLGVLKCGAQSGTNHSTCGLQRITRRGNRGPTHASVGVEPAERIETHRCQRLGFTRPHLIRLRTGIDTTSHPQLTSAACLVCRRQPCSEDRLKRGTNLQKRLSWPSWVVSCQTNAHKPFSKVASHCSQVTSLPMSCSGKQMAGAGTASASSWSTGLAPRDSAQVRICWGSMVMPVMGSFRVCPCRAPGPPSSRWVARRLSQKAFEMGNEA